MLSISCRLAASGNLQFNCDGRSSSIYELFFVGFVDQPLPRLQLGHCSEAPDSRGYSRNSLFSHEFIFLD